MMLANDKAHETALIATMYDGSPEPIMKQLNVLISLTGGELYLQSSITWNRK
jgi:hypothetical protein